MEGDQDVILAPVSPGVRKLVSGLDCSLRSRVDDVVVVISALPEDGVLRWRAKWWPTVSLSKEARLCGHNRG